MNYSEIHVVNRQECSSNILKEALSQLMLWALSNHYIVQKWWNLGIFVFCLFSCEKKNWHKLKKLNWIWHVVTARPINHNVGALKKTELLDVILKHRRTSINVYCGCSGAWVVSTLASCQCGLSSIPGWGSDPSVISEKGFVLVWATVPSILGWRH